MKANIIDFSSIKKSKEETVSHWNKNKNKIFSGAENSLPKKEIALSSKLESENNADKVNLVKKDIDKLNKTELMRKYKGEYNTHKNMKSRCKEKGYILHPEFNVFSDFLSILGPKPEKEYTLDRIDNNNPEYSPENVRWASKSLQTSNRSNTRFLELETGEVLSVAECYRRSGIPIKTILNRIDNFGWSADEAISTKVGDKRKSKIKSETALNASSYVSIWKQSMKDFHGQSFCSFTSKEVKMIKDLAKRFLDEGLNPNCVIEKILSRWGEFTLFAEKKYLAYGNIPEYPVLEWLIRYCTAAGNFYIEMDKKEKESIRKNEEIEGKEKLRKDITERLKKDERYRKLIYIAEKLLHPDVNEEALVFKAVNEAYEWVSDFMGEGYAYSDYRSYLNLREYINLVIGDINSSIEKIKGSIFDDDCSLSIYAEALLLIDESKI